MLWIAIGLATASFAYAALRGSQPVAIVGCVLAAPLFLYLSLTPRLRWYAVIAYIMLCAYAWRVRRGDWITSVILLLPAVSMTLWLGYVVLDQ